MLKRPYTILCLDDEAQFRKIFKNRLEEEGFRVITGVNGYEGLELLQKETPNLILTDITMPEMGGLKFIQEFYKKKSNRKIPVLCLSNLSNPEDLVEAEKLTGRKGIVKAHETLGKIVSIIRTVLKIDP
jgi:CheY-like chemotaxis protein